MDDDDIAELRLRLNNRPRTLYLKEIEQETGIKLRWLQDFASNLPGKRNRVMLLALRNFLDQRNVQMWT